MTEKDIRFMQMAIDLAEKGRGLVNPNPMVGAVIVKDGEVIGRGYHERFGGPHAERNAINDCSVSPEGATIYVNLEPCCHHGKTPPCTNALIQSGIKRAVIGVVDPNQLVSGEGIKLLEDAGISVTQGVLREECAELNEVFLHYTRTKRPYVIMKYAMTADGKIATYTGESKWITGEAARARVQEDRSRYMAIMVGVGTILADDPLLTCRAQNGRNPIRIICDTELRTPLDSQIVKTANETNTIIATAHFGGSKGLPYEDAGCKVMNISKKDGHLDLDELIKKLGQIGIDSVILEGGATLNWSAMQSGIVNKVQAYIAPKIFGGAGAATPVAGIGVDRPGDAFFLINGTIEVLGEDILFESEVRQRCSRE